MNKCDGCIYCIVGERKDRQGYTQKTSECLCEKYMAAGCIPTYQFNESDIYKGKMKFEKGLLVFHISTQKALRNDVSFSGKQNKENSHEKNTTQRII